MRVLPPAPVRISASSPLRWLSLSTTTPANSSSTSIVTSSIGSSRWPPSSRKSTRGRETESSKPSRRMFSTSTPICSSPRPATSKASPAEVSLTLIATFDLGLAHQPLADHPALHLVAVAAGERASR